MANDAGVAEQPLDVARSKARNPLEIESRKHLAERVAFSENRSPAQTGLKTFETNLLEQPTIVGNRESPFAIVVSDIDRIFASPVAAANGFTNRSVHRKGTII